MSFNPQKQFSPQQIKASNEIQECFLSEDPMRWVLLFAQMQSGKTSTFLLTACEMLRKKKVSQVVLFCGHSDVRLREQLEKEIKKLDECFGRYFRYLKSLNLSEDVLEESFDYIRPTTEKFLIVWGGTRLTRDIKFVPRDTLFIWDESHFAQSVTNAPAKFFQTIEISPDGNTEVLTSGNNYFISVSATPFSEISDFFHLNQRKGTVTLDISESYNSVEKMIEGDRIRYYDTSKMAESIELALSEAETFEPNYAIIRTSEKTEPLVEQGIKPFWKVVKYNSDADHISNIGKNTWENMKTSPLQHTVILIRERCRMGEVVEKKNVRIMIETSSKPKTDTLLQSLIGRACGYGEGSSHVVVWVSNEAKELGDLETYAKLCRSPNPRIVTPISAKNLTSPSFDRKNIMNFAHPIQLDLGNTTNGTSSRNRREVIEDALKKLTTYNDEIQNRFDAFQQKELIQTCHELLNADLKNRVDNKIAVALPNSNERKRRRVEFHQASERFHQEITPPCEYYNTSKQSSDPSIKKWNSLINNLSWFSKTVKEPSGEYEPEPKRLWQTTRIKDPANGDAKIEGYYINLFYFEKEHLFQTEFDEFLINPNTLFIYGVTNSSYLSTEELPHREPIRIPKTTGKEIFGKKLEELEEKLVPEKIKEDKEPEEIQKPQTMFLSPETSTNISEMKIQLLIAIKMSLEYPHIRRILTTVSMTKSVYNEFQKKGEILLAVNEKYKDISLKVIGKKGKASKYLPEGHRHYTITW